MNTYRHPEKRITLGLILREFNKHFLPLEVKLHLVLFLITAAGFYYYSVNKDILFTLLVALVPNAVIFMVSARLTRHITPEQEEEERYEHVFYYYPEHKRHFDL